MISITENTPTNSNNIVNKLIKNSFFKLSIAFQLIIIQIGVNKILKVIKNKEIPSTVINILPQFKILEYNNQL